MTILLVLLIIYFIKEQFKFSRVRRIKMVIIPIYSLLILCEKFRPTSSNFLMLFWILLVSILVSYFQAKNTEIKTDSENDKYGRKKSYIKGGVSYLVGWLIILVVGIVLNIIVANNHEYWKYISETLVAEIFKMSIFSSNNTWYIWALSGISSTCYTLWLIKFYPDVRSSLRRRK